MKRILSFFIVCSIVATQGLTTLAVNKPLAEVKQNANALVVLQESSSKTDGVKSTSLDKFRGNFQENLNENYRDPTKWEITKNIAKYLGESFVNDVKSYILFYPLFKVSQLISFFVIYLPAYAFYKKTGIDVPAKVSSVFTKSESLNIIGQNLYNVIPLTLASFLFKWGKDLYSYIKT